MIINNAPKDAPEGTTSTLYDHIVTDFLDRLEKDDGIPSRIVQNLKDALTDASAKSTTLLAAFMYDDDIQ